MTTVFEKIISGQWAGRFAWSDEVCVAFATIEPVAPGHVLVVPRHPYEKWTSAPSSVSRHLMDVAQIIGIAQESAFSVPRAGLVIAGFEVPHTHLHVIPLRNEKDVLLSAAKAVSEDELDQAMTLLRHELVAQGHAGHVPPRMGSATLEA